MEFLDLVATWFANNWDIAALTGGAGIVSGYAIHWISKTLTPRVLLLFKNIIVLIFSQGFGMSDDKSETLMEKLPFVSKFEKLAEQIEMFNQVKLDELQHNMDSPIYTEEEKAIFQNRINILVGVAEQDILDKVSELIGQVKNTDE